MKGMIRLTAVALVLAGVAAGGWFVFRPKPAPTPVPDAPPKAEAPSPAAPNTAEERTAAIHASEEVIRAECQRAAGGDWDRWLTQLAPFRAELTERMRASERPGVSDGETIMEGKEAFPLFEGNPHGYVRYLTDPASVEEFRRGQAVVAAARWLKRRGIDLVFVPVPKMTEVYPEHFSYHCPDDHIVAPHVRRTLLELLEADVEVVDLLPAFLEQRDKAAEYLYQPADPHWSTRGQEIGARAVGERLKRYDFVRQALAGPPVFKNVELPIIQAAGRGAFPFLTPPQQGRALKAEPKTWPAVTNLSGGPLVSDDSPVVFIGDSYNCGLWERVGREINLPIHLLYRSGTTTEIFRDFARDPELLRGCKVVVWVVCNSGLQYPWTLPAPILREAAADRSPQ